MLAVGLAPVVPGTSQPETAYAAEAANSTVTITHQPVGGTFASDSPVRLYVQASSTSGGLLTYQWYRNTANTTSGGEAVGNGTSICDDTPASAGTYYYYAVVTDKGSGKTATSSTAKVEIASRTLASELGNGDFSQASYAYAVEGNKSNIYNDPYWTGYTQIPSWNTTEYRASSSNPRTIQRIVSSAFQTSNGKPDSDTNIGAELSGNMQSCLYQEIATIPGKLFSWSLKHSARSTRWGSSTDVMAVVIGPAVEGVDDYASYTADYPYGKNDQGYLNDVVDQVAKEVTKNSSATGSALAGYGKQQFTTTYQGKPYYVYITADSDATRSQWGSYSGTYTVPEGQGSTVFGFVSVKCLSAGSGNLLDDISFAKGTGVEIHNDVAYDGGGQITTDVVETGFSYGIVEERGSTTSAVTPEVTLGGKELLVSSLGAGTSDWYTPETTGKLVFGNLTPGKTYRVVAMPASAINTTTKTNLSPGLVLDEDYYESVTIKPVSDPSDGSGGNIQATAEATAGNKARIIVNPARTDVEYALLKTDGTGRPLAQAADGCGWTLVKDGSGKLYFEGLARSTSYAVVARPYGYEEIDYKNQVDAGAYVVVGTPSDKFKDLSAADGSVARSLDGQTIYILNMSGQKQRYTVYDALTGAAVGAGWQELDAYNDNPDKVLEVKLAPEGAERTYQVVTAELDKTCAPSPGVRVLAPAPDPDIDYEGETVGKGGIVPKTVEYRMQGAGTDSTWYFGDADGQPGAWVQGTGGSPVSLRTALNTMTAGGSGATLTYRTHTDFDGPVVYVEKEVAIPARPAAPADPSVWYTFDYARELLVPASGVAGIEARTSSVAEWTRATTDAGLALSKLNWTGSQKAFQLRLAAVKAAEGVTGSFASASTDAASIPARPAAPDVGVLLNASGDTAAYHFTGTGVDASEYRDYTSAPNGPYATCKDVSDLAKGHTYEVRTAASQASDGTLGAFASYSLLRAASEAQLEATAPVLEGRDFGYTDAPSADFTLTNSGKSSAVVGAADATDPATVKVVMVSAPEAYTSDHPGEAAFTVTGEGAKLKPKNALSAQEAETLELDEVVWKVTAKKNLPAGVYEASITVQYKDGGVGGDETEYLSALCSVTFAIEKATPDSPKDAFHVVEGSVTSTSVTLSAMRPTTEPHEVGIEFSTAATSGYRSVVPDDLGIATLELSGLGAATCYEFYARTAADDNHHASEPAKILACTAWAAPAADAVKFNYAAETVSSVPEGCELRAAESDTADILALNSAVSAYLGKKLYLRHVATSDAANLEDSTPASAWVDVDVPARPVIADDTESTDATSSRVEDGSITVHNVASFQYRKKGSESWVDVPGTYKGDLPAGIYEARTPATGSAFASVPLTITIKATIVYATFDLGYEGGVAPQEQELASGAVATKPSVDPVREGYDFAGWYTSDGGGATLAGSAWDFSTPLVADVVLYAAWTPHTYTVEFDPGVVPGDTPAVTGSTADQLFTYGTPQTLTSCGYSRANYEFKGWSKTAPGAGGAAGTVDFADMAEVSDLTPEALGTLALYAVWAHPTISAAVPVNATVVVDAGGTFTCPSAYDPATPDAGGYRITSTTNAHLKVESVAFDLEEGALDIFTAASGMTATVNGLVVGTSDGAKDTTSQATRFKLAASKDGSPVSLPLELTLAYPGGTMTYAHEARPFARITYKLAYDDEAAASGKGA